jgi:hypothetical protein
MCIDEKKLQRTMHPCSVELSMDVVISYDSHQERSPNPRSAHDMVSLNNEQNTVASSKVYFTCYQRLSVRLFFVVNRGRPMRVDQVDSE